MSARTTINWFRGLGFMAATALVACGGGSDSETNSSGGSGGTGGSGMSGTGGKGSGGSSGASGKGGSAGSTGGSGGTGGSATGGSSGSSGSSGSAGTGGGACNGLQSVTLAVHIIMDATWPSSTATNAGTGKIHLWNLSRLNASGTALSGETLPCGTVLPEFTLNAIGTIAAGGSKIEVEVPFSVWDSPSMPKLSSAGMLSGWDPGSTLQIDGTVALVGLTMADPMGAWPASYSDIAPTDLQDVDGDGKPGFSAVPKTGDGYVRPPTQIGIGGSAPAAEKLYLVSRTVVGLNGTFTSCDEQSGNANVTLFDSHVVGCDVTGGDDCDEGQTDFLDQSRTIYEITGATFTSKKIADGATCADARTALPM